MVYTLTFNPSIDYVVKLDEFIPGKVNRTAAESILAGGKGINVSIVLNNLGIQNTALGFIAGFTGDEIERRLKKAGCNTNFIRVQNGFSRINVKLKTESESEINGKGPELSKEDITKLYCILEELRDKDVLIMAGSIPDTLPDSVYMDILERLQHKQLKIVVDATKDLLKNVLKYQPFLIKPNHHELEELFGVPVDTEEKMIAYGEKLLQMGACNVLVSRAEKGAILICEDKRVIKCKAPSGSVVNSVGAGDSMVAGFVAGYLEKRDYEYALKLGISAGSASAFSERLATESEIKALFQNL